MDLQFTSTEVIGRGSDTYTQHGQHSSEKHTTSVDEEIGVKTRVTVSCSPANRTTLKTVLTV